MHDIIPLVPDSRWKVVASDAGSWRAGLYRPECGSPEEVRELEKHTCPELFVCMGGRAGLVISDGREEHVAVLTPGQALLVTDYHAGFSVDRGGFFLVTERTSFTTEYIDRSTGALLRRVEV